MARRLLSIAGGLVWFLLALDAVNKHGFSWETAAVIAMFLFSVTLFLVASQTWEDER